MGAQKLNVLDFDIKLETEEEDFEIPLDIEDIITICREYGKLGWGLQSQVETVLKIGVAEAIEAGQVKKEALPHIKEFLQQIVSGICVGDAVSQASDCIDLINQYQRHHKPVSKLN
jgi:hypothetical protein